MSDKDLLVVISEMLRKQDQHTEIISETNVKLQKFIDISVEHFTFQQHFAERQEKFNERQEDLNKHILGRLENIDNNLKNLTDYDERIKRLEATVFK